MLAKAHITIGMAAALTIAAPESIPEALPVITGAAAYPENLIAKLEEKGAVVDAMDCLTLAEEAGSSKAVNIVLMGRLSKYFDIPAEKWQQAIEALVPEKFRVHRFVRGQAADLVQVQVLPEVNVAEVAELLDQVLPGFMGDVPAVEDTVDEPSQFRIGELLVVIQPRIVGFIQAVLFVVGFVGMRSDAAFTVHDEISHGPADGGAVRSVAHFVKLVY